MTKAMTKAGGVAGFDPSAPVGPDRLYRPREAATLLGMSTRTLEAWRRGGHEPRPVQIVPGGPPRYRGRDLLALLDAAAKPVPSPAPPPRGLDPIGLYRTDEAARVLGLTVPEIEGLKVRAAGFDKGRALYRGADLTAALDAGILE